MRNPLDMTRAQLQRLGRRYQKLLGLSQWKLRFEFADQQKIGGSSDYFYYGGSADINLEKTTATVRIARPRDLQKQKPGEELGLAVQRVLMHELLHILLDPSQRMAEDALFEVGLDRLSAIIVP